MGIIVRLEKIVEAMEYPEDWECYLDRNSGEIITVTENEAPYIEGGEEGEDADISDLPEWQRESIADVRRALQSADLVPLPDRFDIHEWSIMRRFADSQSESDRRELLDAIHGRGAFRAFRSALDRLGLRDEWYSYRDEVLEQIASDWLNEHGIRFTKGG